MSDLLLDYNGLVRYDSKIKQYIDSGMSSINQDITQINQSLAGKTVTSSIAITIDTSDWNGTSVTVPASGVTTSNNVIVVPDPASASIYANSQILCIAQGSDSLTFECSDIPSFAVTVNVLIID